jgi:hypothetical protein
MPRKMDDLQVTTESGRLAGGGSPDLGPTWRLTAADPPFYNRRLVASFDLNTRLPGLPGKEGPHAPNAKKNAGRFPL